MLSREYIIEFLNKKVVQEIELLTLITEYALERGKDKADINLYILEIMRSPFPTQIIHNCLKNIKSYYIQKYEIHSVSADEFHPPFFYY